MRSNSLGFWVTVASIIASILLSIVFLGRLSRIPPDFQFESHFSKRQAEMFYAKARQQQRESYWSAMRANLSHQQFAYAWNRWKKGRGHIEGVLTNANSDVMVCVKFKNGEVFWLTLES